MSESMSDGTLRKVRALMAKTVAAGCTEAEAATASAKVAEVLATYNLTMTDVEAAEPNTSAAKRDKTMSPRSATYAYQQDLMSAIAEANFCKHWIVETLAGENNKTGSLPTSKVKRHMLLGREVNVISANMLYDYLIETITKVMPNDIKKSSGGNGRPAISFRMGCAARLTERVLQDHANVLQASRRAKAEAATAARHPSAAASGNALALVDVFGSEEDLNNDAYWEYPAGTTAARKAKEQASYAAAMERLRNEPRPVIARAPLPPAPVLTPAELAAQAKEAERLRAKWQREDERAEERSRRDRARAAERIDARAYSAGASAGASISLSKQVDRDERKVIK